MLGALLSLASAALFGLNNATLRRGVVRGSVLQAMAITVPFGVPLFIFFAAIMGGFEAMRDWGLAPWLWMTAAGVIHFVVGRYGNYRATQLLGATLSTPIQQVSILVALLLALAFLGESLSPVNALGVALVMLGPMMVVRRRSANVAAGKSKELDPQDGPGMFWGAVSAVGYGASPLFVALGIGEGGIADSVGGLLVSYVAATIVVLAWIIAIGGRRALGPLDADSGRWFLASAVFVGLSQLFRYTALAIAPVTVVTPIQRLSVVFRLIFNAILNRDHEVFDRWVIASILLSVIGAVALATDTGALLGWLGMSHPRLSGLAAPLF